MKRSHVRGLVYSIQVVAVVCGVAALANCSGSGERPPAAADDPIDAAVNDSATNGSAVTISPAVDEKGILLGDNGFVNCGAQAPEKVITLKNPRPDIINFKAAFTAGEKYFKLNPKEGGIPAKGEANIQIIPEPIPQTSDIAPDLYAGTLEIQTADGAPPLVVRLHQTARGAIISSTLKELYDFGDVKVGTTGTIPFSLTNSGNLEVTATLNLGSQNFKIDNLDTATVKLAPADTVSKTLGMISANTVDYTDTLALSFNSSAVHCKTPPVNTNLKGHGTTSVGVSPGTVNFGQVDCGTSVQYQVVTVTSTAAMEFTPVLEKGEAGTSPYTLANDANGAALTPGVAIPMAAASQYKLRVIPKTVPFPSPTTNGFYDDVLRITSTAPGDQPHLVTLKETARGAILVLDPTLIDVPNVGGTGWGQTVSKPWKIINNGNQPAAYIASVAPRVGTPADAFKINLSNGNVVPLTPIVGNVDMKAPSTGLTQYLGDIQLTVQGGTVLCGDLPPKMFLSITTAAQ